MIETNRYLWFFIQNLFRMKGKGLKERILANRQLNALSMMKKAAKEPSNFNQSEALANEKAAFNGRVKRLSVVQHSSHIRWRL